MILEFMLCGMRCKGTTTDLETRRRLAPAPVDFIGNKDFYPKNCGENDRKPLFPIKSIVYGEGVGREGKSDRKRREAWPGGHASALSGTARGSAGLGEFPLIGFVAGLLVAAGARHAVGVAAEPAAQV